jgi:2-keto-4-pentenoate hydratase/2-oxohepta-3-ene-1,7-dioic acid hydratase in catechol pathway
MELLTFFKNGETRLGVKIDQTIIDVKAAAAVKSQEDIPTDVMSVIQGGQEKVYQLMTFIQELDLNDSDYVLNEHHLEWGPCVTNPGKIICVGLNYRKHADETNAPYPDVPILFSKFNNTLTGHKKDIAVPKITNKLDYEVELAIVIGKRAKYISKENALDYVFGYCVGNDLSARDLQLRTNQWLLGKTCDDFCPLGPYLITADVVGNPNNLSLKTTVNGEVRQNSNTSDMIFYCDELVSYISHHMTLTPGDIILTGTPAGVVLGLPENKRVYLKPGDVVTVEIEKLGKLTNKFVEE